MAQEVKRKGDISGMSGVFMGTRWRRFFFWTLIILLAVLTIRDVVKLFDGYLDNEKQADMNMVFNQSMTFPTFTFCLPMPMIKSMFNSTKMKTAADFGENVSEESAVHKTLKKLKTKDAFLKTRWDRRALRQAVRIIGQLHTLERESDDSFVARELLLLNRTEKGQQKLEMIYFWLGEIEQRNITFDEFVQKAGSEILERIIKKSQRVSQLNNKKFNSKFKTTWVSSGNMCFQPIFDENGSTDIKTPGHFYDIVFEHDPEYFDNDIHCIMVDMNGRLADTSRFIDSGGHTKDGVSEEICPGTDNDLIVEVRATYQMIDNDDKGTACVDFEKNEDVENEFDCRTRCRMKLIRSICSCTGITMQRFLTTTEADKYPPCEYKDCEIDVQTAAKSEKSCTRKCRRDCKQTRYTINLVGSLESGTSNETSGERTRTTHLTRARLAWGSFEYFQLEQNYKYESVMSFASEVGGAIGIWLGLSVLTLIQGAAYVGELVAQKISGKSADDYEDDEEDSQSPIGPVRVSANPFGEYQGKSDARKRSNLSNPSQT